MDEFLLCGKTFSLSSHVLMHDSYQPSMQIGILLENLQLDFDLTASDLPSNLRSFTRTGCYIRKS